MVEVVVGGWGKPAETKRMEEVLVSLSPSPPLNKPQAVTLKFLRSL